MSTKIEYTFPGTSCAGCVAHSVDSLAYNDILASEFSVICYDEAWSHTNWAAPITFGWRCLPGYKRASGMCVSGTKYEKFLLIMSHFNVHIFLNNCLSR